MQYEPVSSTVIGTPVEHDGVPLVVVTIGGQRHLVERGAFELLFRPADIRPSNWTDGYVSLQEVSRIGSAASLIADNVTGNGVARPAMRKSKGAQRKKPAPEPNQEAFEGYPVALRDVRSVSMRGAYDALQDGPKPLDQIVAAMNLAGIAVSSAAVIGALGGLREKGLAKRRDDSQGGGWILI